MANTRPCFDRTCFDPKCFDTGPIRRRATTFYPFPEKEIPFRVHLLLHATIIQSIMIKKELHATIVTLFNSVKKLSASITRFFVCKAVVTGAITNQIQIVKKLFLSVIHKTKKNKLSAKFINDLLDDLNKLDDINKLDKI